jgi:hypothetical protein
VSAQDLAVVRGFLDALVSAANTGDDDCIYPLLDADVEWLTPLRRLRGLGELRGQPSWPWIVPPESFEIDFQEQETTDLGDGRIAADFREVYRMKETGAFAYARERSIELTVRGDKISRYEMRFEGS